MNPTLATLLSIALASPFAAAHAVSPAKPTDGAVLREQIVRTYPSLRYVDLYRKTFPDEIQGKQPFWTPGPTINVDRPEDLVAALAQLQDQHVALVGPSAGKTETLGVLFRSAADGSVVAWRLFDPATIKTGVQPGDQVLAIDGVPTQAWLERAAAVTFGGNRRGRQAEAALDLGLGTPIVHKMAKLGASVTLSLQTGDATPRDVRLSYQPMSADLAGAMAAAINRPDLPATIDAHGVRLGTLRLGAFAPQYDPLFIAASDAAAAKPGTTDDQAMLAGYCALVGAFISQYDALATNADVMVLDLRGNLGGFDREARLLADAIAPSPSPATWDFTATGKPDTVKLTEEVRDPSCGHVTQTRPLVVLDDAGTRSAGEFMATWLWTSGATVIGETTPGAGGGFEFADAQDTLMPTSGLRVRTSGNFTAFDPTGQLHAGEMSEQALVAQISADQFRPSRTRPFAFQSVGLRPDQPLATTLSDLRDGGVSALTGAIAALKKDGKLRSANGSN